MFWVDHLDGRICIGSLVPALTCRIPDGWKVELHSLPGRTFYVEGFETDPDAMLRTVRKAAGIQYGGATYQRINTLTVGS